MHMTTPDSIWDIYEVNFCNVSCDSASSAPQELWLSPIDVSGNPAFAHRVQMDSFSFVPNSKAAFYQCLACLPVAEDSEEFIGCRITVLVLKSREDRDFIASKRKQ